VREEVLRAFDVEGPVFAFDLDLEALEKHLPGRRAYRELPRFPAAKRDLSLVVPAHVTYQQIHGAVTAAGGADLESVHCFDVYQGGALGRGERSLGIRLRFRAAKQTLSDAAVDQEIQAIVRRLAESLDVKMRAG
jgi:phenylalanyl-tRNA synthetase beta chain